MAVTVNKTWVQGRACLELLASAANHLGQFQQNIVLALVRLKVDLVVHLKLIDQFLKVVHSRSAGCS